MTIHQLEGPERIDAGFISAVAFHSRISDLEAAKDKWLGARHEDWGAFNDDDILMSHVVNNHFECRLNGSTVLCGGIGAVSTLPEYRNCGAVRAIFKELLPGAYERGEVLSTLYPFSHAFYRKFGYETVPFLTGYSFAPSALKGFLHRGSVRLWKQGDDPEDYLRIYNEFIAKRNLSIVRGEEQMLDAHISDDNLGKRRFNYLLGDGSEAFAYVEFEDVYQKEAACLNVREAAWTCRRGFEAVLGFLARFTADYGTVKLNLPTDIDLRSYLSDPYAVTADPQCGFMCRVVNAKKALQTLQTTQAFTVRVYGDEQLPVNNRIYRVTEDGVFETGGLPDITLSHRALAVLVTGAVPLSAAMLRSDVEIIRNESVLESVFSRKSIYVGDHF